MGKLPNSLKSLKNSRQEKESDTCIEDSAKEYVSEIHDNGKGEMQI